MAKLIFATLFSGSSGNSVYISYGEDAILIDAGKSTKCIEQALSEIGEDARKLRAVFVTHEHTDHIAALPVLAKKYGIPVYINAVCADAMRELPPHAVLFDGTLDLSVGPFAVRSFFTPHDSAKALGYTVCAAGRKFGVATDMGMLAKSVVNELTGCDAALIETNYDEQMLREGPYTPPLKARIASERGHLSNESGALLAAVLAYTGTKSLLLGHLSAENNTPEKALTAVRAEFDKRGVSALVKVAQRDCPTLLIKEEI